jgi:regulator of replication initiation timing
MDITPEQLVEHFKTALAENYFLRLRVADLERQLDEATAPTDDEKK